MSFWNRRLLSFMSLATMILGVGLASPVAGRSGHRVVSVSSVVAQQARGPSELVLVRGPRGVELRHDGRVVEAWPTRDTESLEIEGSPYDDTLVIDLSQGNPLPPGGIVYDGAGESSTVGDSLELRGGYVDELVYDATGPEAGIVQLDDLGSIRFSELEPISVTSGIGTLTVNIIDGQAHTVVSRNHPDSGRSEITIDGGLESVVFSIPSNSLVINAGAGDDRIFLQAQDPSWSGSIAVNGGAGDDFISAEPTGGSSIFVSGGEGDDTIILYNASHVVSVSGGINATVAGDSLFFPDGFLDDFHAGSGTVRLPSGAAVSYTTIEDGGTVPDPYEPNDSIASAFPLGSPLQITLSGVWLLAPAAGTDVDFWAFTANRTGAFVLETIVQSGTVEQELQAGTGTVIATASATTTSSSIVAPVVSGETYYLRLTSSDGNPAIYSLDLQNLPVPVAQMPTLLPSSDTGVSNSDNVVQASAGLDFRVVLDASEFARLGIEIDASGFDPGLRATITVRSVTENFSVSTNMTQVSGNRIWSASIPGGILRDGGHFVTVVPLIIDGQAGGSGVGAIGSGPESPGLFMTVDGSAPQVARIGSLADTGDGVLAEGETTSAVIKQLLVDFDEPIGGSGPADFLLVTDGGDGFETTTCTGGAAGTDRPISIDSVTWSGGSTRATLWVQGGVLLYDNAYRLIVCPTNEDIAGNPLAAPFIRTFTVTGVNPVALAGPDRTLATGMEVDINHETIVLGELPTPASGGTAPYDFLWTITPNTGVTLSSSTDPNPTFTGSTLGLYTAQLLVTDDADVTATDSALIEVVCPEQINLFQAVLVGADLYEAKVSISAEETIVSTGSDLVFRAADVVSLRNGFSVEQGATFRVEIPPSVTCVP